MTASSHNQQSPLPSTLVHLGMPKTATTFLQMFLFAEHSQIVYLGKRESQPLYCTPAVVQIIKQLRKPGYQFTSQRVEECRQAVDRHRQPDKMLVVSDEGFTYSGRENKLRQARAMREIFGDCRILITIREPVSLMETLYLQELRGFHYHPEIHTRLFRKFGKPPRHFEIEPWLENAWSTPHHGAFDHLMVYDTADAYASVFGDENIVVMVYEEMKVDNLGFIRRLSESLGIDAAESGRLCANQSSSKNARWSQANVDRLKLFNESLWLRLKYRYFKSTYQLKEFLGVVGPNVDNDSPMARAEMSDLWRERIRQLGKDQYSRLAGRWNLSLESHRYSIDPKIVAAYAAQHAAVLDESLRRKSA